MAAPVLAFTIRRCDLPSPSILRKHPKVDLNQVANDLQVLALHNPEALEIVADYAALFARRSRAAMRADRA